jgi:hypothetical protein
MKRKEVADVMGGKEEWENAEQMAGEYCPHLFSAGKRGKKMC